MAGRIILVTTLLVVLTSFHQDPPLHKTSAAARSALSFETDSRRFPPVDPELAATSVLQSTAAEIDEPVEESCYTLMSRRPASQRAEAVQARLRHADRMTAAFDPNLLTVDILGDHVNILSLEFPGKRHDKSAYVQRISAVVDDYFSSQNIKDYLCQAGFAEVRLSARSLGNQPSHPVWRAQVTAAGLVKLGSPLVSAAAPDPSSLSSSNPGPMVFHK